MIEKYAFLDLDGTLLKHMKKISKKNIVSLQNFINSNGEVIICTGRWPISANIFNNQITNFTNKANPYLISLNGAYIEDLNQNKIIYQSPIRNDVFEKLLLIQKKFNVPMWIYSKYGIENRKIFSLNIPFKKIVSKFNYGQVINYDHEKYKNDDKYKILFISLNKKKINKLYKWLSDNFSSYLSVIKTSSKNIEITAKNIDKGFGVKKIMELKNINLNQVYAFGDSGNDVAMFLNSGYRFSFGNKNKTLNSISNFCLDSNNKLASIINNIASNNYDVCFEENKKSTLFIEISDNFNNIKSLEITKFWYLWNYIINQKNVVINSPYYPNWSNKIIFRDFLLSKFSILKSNNLNSTYSEKEKKFIFAKSFSDTQIKEVEKFFDNNIKNLKIFIYENINNELFLVYQNEKILNIFLKKFNFSKDFFTSMKRYDFFNRTKEFKNVLSVSLFGIFPKELENNFLISKQDEIFHILNKNENEKENKSKHHLTFKLSNNKNTNNNLELINNFIKKFIK